jgi:hypothetical protein
MTSRRAASRKLGWQDRYAADWSTIVYDDRKGAKFSGHRLHYRAGVGSAKLSDLQRVNYAHLLDMRRG